MRSTYSARVSEDGLFVLVEDEDVGMSVTNDIDRVVVDLAQGGLLEPGRRVLYRDSEGDWDEARVDEGLHFHAFFALRLVTGGAPVRTAEAAMAAARQVHFVEGKPCIAARTLAERLWGGGPRAPITLEPDDEETP